MTSTPTLSVPVIMPGNHPALCKTLSAKHPVSCNVEVLAQYGSIWIVRDSHGHHTAEYNPDAGKLIFRQ